MANVTRWNPQNDLEINDPFRPFERMMDAFWRGWPSRYNTETTRPILQPAMDVVESDNHLTVRLDLPGLKPEDVHVEMENGILSITGEVGDTVEKEGDRYHYRERSYGSFQRSLRLPNTFDAENIDASFDNGVLNITLPKLPQAQPKQIPIKTNKK
jgi:HSP20 family protein